MQRPTDLVDHLLGLAAIRYKLQLHGWVIMPNHIHLVLTDVGARLPDATHFLILQTSRFASQTVGI